MQKVVGEEMTGQVQGMVALVTGGASGMGPPSPSY